MEKKLKLELTSWQKRMIHDFVKVEKDLGSIEIDFGVIKCPASYKVPDVGLSRGDWVLYLTDEQMLIVKDRLNLQTPFSGINITERLINKGEVVFR